MTGRSPGCASRVSTPPAVRRILDAERGGALTVAPSKLVASRQRYEVASGVLVTEMRAPGGVLRVTDALTIRKGADLAEDASASRSELIRSARVLDGQVELLIEVAPWRRAVRGEGGEGMVIRDPDGDIHVWGSQPLQGLRTLQVLEAGEEFHLVLR